MLIKSCTSKVAHQKLKDQSTITKEDDEATVQDINETYNYVRELLKKINSENKKTNRHADISYRINNADNHEKKLEI